MNRAVAEIIRALNKLEDEVRDLPPISSEDAAEIRKACRHIEDAAIFNFVADEEM